MALNSNDTRGTLTRIAFIFAFVCLSFFICTAGNSRAFDFGNFDFDEFAEHNRFYWTHHCVWTEDSEQCVEETLARQRVFYTRLYSLLANYQRRGLMINDTVIIKTVFFELNPHMFTDDGDFYNNILGSGRPYRWQDNDLINFNINQNDDNVDFWVYVEDNLQLLLRAMIGYSYTCYGSTGRPETINNEDGTTSQFCPNGGNIMDGHCMVRATSGYMSFAEYLLSRQGAAEEGGFRHRLARFFGNRSDAEIECRDLRSEHNGHTVFRQGAPSVNEDRYWEFLETSRYFDRKPHLQYRFARVLRIATCEGLGCTRMDDLTEDEYEEFQDEIEAVRRGIIRDIRAILENYGATNRMSLWTQAESNAFWWPVGSHEITTDGSGNQFAVGPPATTTITSPFGYRVHPVHGGYRMHNGVDIAGGGSPPIIAAQSGVVNNVIGHCQNGDSSCGGGFGNFVMLTHADGTETVYAHLAPGSVRVSHGDNVSQGQVLGIMGTTGTSTGIHLHFEVRINGQPVDPMDFISAENPRPTGMVGASSDLVRMLICMEGTGPTDGDFYIVYDNAPASNPTPTVGPGVVIRYHRARFQAHGVDPDAINHAGARVPRLVVDTIKGQILDDMRASVTATLTREGLNLNPQQIDALISRMYNMGNINAFPENYRRFGNTQALFDNHMNRPVTAYGAGVTLPGLVNRRQWEWNLFHRGVYHTC